MLKSVVQQYCLNIGLVLGMTALITSLGIQKTTVKFEWPVMMFGTFFFYLLARDGRTRVTVVGHTDDVGPEDYNRRLSLERARAVEGVTDLYVEPQVLVRQVRALQRRRDQQTTLKACQVPALVLCGAHDRLVTSQGHGNAAVSP